MWASLALTSIVLVARPAWAADTVKTSQADYEQAGAVATSVSTGIVPGSIVLLPGEPCLTASCIASPFDLSEQALGDGAHAVRNVDGTFLLIHGGGTCDTTIYDPLAATPFTMGPPTRPGTCDDGGVGLGGHSFRRDDGSYALVHGASAPFYKEFSLYDPVTGAFSVESDQTFSVGSGAHTIRIGPGRFLIVHGGSTNKTSIYEVVAGSYALSAGPDLCEDAGPGAHAIRLGSSRWLIITDALFPPQTCLVDVDALGTVDITAGPTIEAGKAVGAGGHSIDFSPTRFLVILGGGSTATRLGTIDVAQATVAFSAGPSLTATAGDGATSLQLPDGRYLVLHGSTSSLFDPTNPDSMTSGMALPLTLGAGALALQADDGGYLLVAGDGSSAAAQYDAGFANQGTWLSEIVAPPVGIGAWSDLQWTALGTVTVRVGTDASGALGDCEDLPRTVTTSGESLGAVEGDGYLRLCAELARQGIAQEAGEQSGVWRGSSLVGDRVASWPIAQIDDITANFNARPATAAGLAATDSPDPVFTWSAFADDARDLSDPLQSTTVAALQLQVCDPSGCGVPYRDTGSLPCTGNCDSYASSFGLGPGSYWFRVRRQDSGTPPVWSDWSATTAFAVSAVDTGPVDPDDTSADTSPGTGGCGCRVGAARSSGGHPMSALLALVAIALGSRRTRLDRGSV